MGEQRSVLAVVRLAVLVLAVLAAGLVFGALEVVPVAEVRRVVEAAGPLAPVAYAAAGALLGAVLVPGPVLAGGSGLLFGPVVGTVVTLASALGTAVLALLLGRAAGREGARAVLGAERAVRADALVRRRGLLAVAVQRLAPGVPDAPATYAFGALGVALWQVVGGTLVGSAPRAFAYTALGASLDDPTSPLAVAGLVTWLVVAVVGAELGRRWWTGRRDA